jgi:hypothetical protein
MESVSSIPTIFLVAAGIFVVSVALLVFVLWLGRRWLIGPLHRLTQEVEQLKEAEHQPSSPVETAISPQEATTFQAPFGLEPKLHGSSDIQDPGSLITPGVHSESAVKDAILSPDEGARTMKRIDSSPAAEIGELSPEEIYEMYCLIHDQIKMGIGEISLLVILYDMHADRIEVAYPAKDMEPDSSPAEDKRLWSVLHTGQALHEITRPGGSWLGVPIRTGNEVLGALVIQNTQLAAGFSENDGHMLANLAAQLAIILRCQRLVISNRVQAEQGQSLASLTRKIWTSSDRDAILRTALEEIGRSLHASGGLIQLEYSDDVFTGQRS